MEERRILREDLEQYQQQCQEITEKLNDALEDNASLTLRLNEVYNMAELFNMNICLLFLKKRKKGNCDNLLRCIIQKQEL